MQAVLAVDIGGTKLAAAVVGLDGGVLGRCQEPTGDGDGAELFDRLCGLVRSAQRAAGVLGGSCAALGVGCGGPMAPQGETVSPLNIAAWRGFPLRAALAERFGLPVFVDNDAKAFARGEGWLGAAQGERNYLAMVVSTGVGAGVVVDGRLLDGASGNAGHLGHVIVTPDGRRCPCGAVGCLEAEASGTSLAAMTGRPAAEAPEALRRRTGRLVGRAVASAVNLLDLRLAVVGGSVALGFGAPFLAAANEELAERSRLSFARGARIVTAGLGHDGPLVGAAALAWHGLGVVLR
ncbi:MAG: ROK family protein [Acidimicrobiales bacterium]|nr:ROK family protein [Acidimicrobiales bacterium]